MNRRDVSAAQKALSSSFHFQVVEELVGKWKSFPEAQHIPLCAHLLGLSMKTVTQLALGERFRDDAEVISFRKNHDAVRKKHLLGEGQISAPVPQ